MELHIVLLDIHLEQIKDYSTTKDQLGGGGKKHTLPSQTSASVPIIWGNKANKGIFQTLKHSGKQ
jgi:hypothetical protein